MLMFIKKYNVRVGWLYTHYIIKKKRFTQQQIIKNISPIFTGL